MIISPALWNISSGWLALDWVFNLLWGGKEHGSMFPISPWLAYPLTGMAFGYWLKKIERKKLYLLTLWTGLALLLTGTLITVTNFNFHAGDYVRSGPGSVIWITGFVLVWLWLCQYAIDTVIPNYCFNLLFFWSKNVTVFYVLQWVIIGWGLMVVGPQQLSLFSTLLAMLSVLILADLGVRTWLWAHEKFTRRQNRIAQYNATE